MAIRVKIATTPKELTDVYRLRYQVYVEGEGYFKDMPGEFIADHFDSMPKIANIIAYSDDTPVGTIRVNCDSEILLPSDELYDFTEYRARISAQAQAQGRKALFSSAGMLAIAKPWRHRRDVFRSMFKMCCDVGHGWGTTHIISAVNIKTATMYARLNFEAISEPVWIEAIGEHIVPLCNDFNAVYDWAFGAFADKSEFIDSFSGCFQCLLISAGSTIFLQDTQGDEAYLIARGMVNISQSDPNLQESLSLATLSRGDMFGELSLIDDQPRSATATALSNTELIVLNRDDFWQKAHQDTVYLNGLLQILTKRLRDIDQRAFIYAHGDVNVRLTFFINRVLDTAHQSSKTPNDSIAKITVDDFAYMASAPHADAETFLNQLQQQQRITLHKRQIVFHGNQAID